MRRANKVAAVALFFALSLISCSYAQERITISTYYPSPFGVYRVLRLFPGASPGTPCEEGSLYFHDGSGGIVKGLYVCVDNGAGGTRWEVYGGFWQVATNPNDIHNINTGNVGIGTTDPASKLQISDNVSIDPALYSRPLYVQMDASGSNPALTTVAFANAAGYGLAIGATDSSTTFAVIDAYRFVGGLGANSINLGLNAGGGNVGIGTINPGAELEVAGQVKITGGAPGAGKVLTSDANGLATWQAGTLQHQVVACTFPGSACAPVHWETCSCPSGWNIAGWSGYNCEQHGGNWDCTSSGLYTDHVEVHHDNCGDAYIWITCIR